MHLRRHVPDVAVPVRTVAFWTAVVLPFVYLPMVLDGFESEGGVALFVGLVAAHVLALSLGHGHEP